ncbi:MAG: carbohydrate kinase [Bacteroidota bacterium]
MEYRPHISVFGEMLWDLLPAGKQPGGAPMNVAVHLHNLGVATSLISKVGQDDLGNSLLTFLQERKLPTDWIQIDPTHATGTVNVNMDDAQEVQYEIVAPVAWDFITLEDALVEKVKASHAFVYETLAAREATSRDTLISLLKVSTFNVLDVNLRPPFYNRSLLTQLFQYAHLLKINHHELAELTDWLGVFKDDQERAHALIHKYEIEGIIVTRGANGSIFIPSEGEPTEHPGYTVSVEDTIGAGDSFLAAFLSQWVQKAPVKTCLDFACALGAMVASSKGANPYISTADVQAFIADHK